MILDFEKDQDCISPFKIVEGLGCLWMYHSKRHSFYDGMKTCEAKEGNVFEFTDFNRQLESMETFLFHHKGNNKEVNHCIKTAIFFREQCFFR